MPVHQQCRSIGVATGTLRNPRSVRLSIILAVAEGHGLTFSEDVWMLMQSGQLIGRGGNCQLLPKLQRCKLILQSGHYFICIVVLHLFSLRYASVYFILMIVLYCQNILFYSVC